MVATISAKIEKKAFFVTLVHHCHWRDFQVEVTQRGRHFEDQPSPQLSTYLVLVLCMSMCIADKMAGCGSRVIVGSRSYILLTRLQSKYTTCDGNTCTCMYSNKIHVHCTCRVKPQAAMVELIEE